MKDCTASVDTFRPMLDLLSSYDMRSAVLVVGRLRVGHKPRPTLQKSNVFITYFLSGYTRMCHGYIDNVDDEYSSTRCFRERCAMCGRGL